MLKKIIYISDLSLPSNKAQAVHIFKLLDNFLQFSDKAILICPNLKKKIQKGFFKKYFNLHSNKDIEIHNLFKKAYSNSFLRRLIFGLKVGIKLRDAIIDYCLKQDTIKIKIDDRITLDEK